MWNTEHFELNPKGSPLCRYLPYSLFYLYALVIFFNVSRLRKSIRWNMSLDVLQYCSNSTFTIQEQFSHTFGPFFIHWVLFNFSRISSYVQLYLRLCLFFFVFVYVCVSHSWNYVFSRWPMGDLFIIGISNTFCRALFRFYVVNFHYVISGPPLHSYITECEKSLLFSWVGVMDIPRGSTLGVCFSHIQFSRIYISR